MTRGHPFLFMLTAGIAGASLADGDPFTAAAMTIVALWLIFR